VRYSKYREPARQTQHNEMMMSTVESKIYGIGSYLFISLRVKSAASQISFFSSELKCTSLLKTIFSYS
jgi:hypothetical protein